MTCSRTVAWTLMLLGCALTACQAGRSDSHPIGSSPPAFATTGEPVAAEPWMLPAVRTQVDRGRALFLQTCTSCHGLRGEGTAGAPGLLGDGTLPEAPPPGRRVRTGAFRTAMDLGMFIKNEMPLGGTHLPPSDVACVLAWLLHERGITPQQPISPATAGAIRLR